jgi:hypothetical protein
VLNVAFDYSAFASSSLDALLYTSETKFRFSAVKIEIVYANRHRIKAVRSASDVHDIISVHNQDTGRPRTTT